VDEIIKPGVTLNSACVFLTRQGMRAERIHQHKAAGTKIGS